MKLRIKRHMAMAIILGSLLVVASDGGSAAATNALPENEAPAIDLTGLADQARWVRMNDRPYRISAQADLQCQAPPTSLDYARDRKSNPHAAAYVTVYVNAMGLKAMRSMDGSRFPQGSMIAKAKFYSNNIQEQEPGPPSLYTVMLKREAGYNPACGDWEFAVVAGDGRTVQARGALASCMTCHETQQGKDYIYRSYLRRTRP